MTEPRLTPELVCSDFKISLDFYTRVAGFTVVYDRPEEGFAMLDHNGGWLMIDQIVPNNRWQTSEMQRPFGRGINLQIQTPDADALYDRFTDADHPIFMEMEEKWYRCDGHYTGNKQFLVQDPDGYLLRFFEDLGERPV